MFDVVQHPWANVLPAECFGHVQKEIEKNKLLEISGGQASSYRRKDRYADGRIWRQHPLPFGVKG